MQLPSLMDFIDVNYFKVVAVQWAKTSNQPTVLVYRYFLSINLI
jgi:hypothetical protein